MSWKRNAHKKKHLKLASNYVTCLQTLYFLLEIIKNSYENKNRKRGCYWPQAWCWEFFFFQYRKFFPKVFPCKSFFPLEISLQDICFLKSHISPPPPPKVKWYESWVWSLMFGSAKHALQKGISSLG